MNIKNTLFVCVVILFSLQLSAQVAGGSNEKLAKLYNTGKYESCLYKADSYTYKENYSSDPEPYLYISMCLYELSKSDDPEIIEDYKDAIKQAIKYVGKFAKKDKHNEYYPLNIEYINTIKKIQKTNVKEAFNAESYKKAASAAKLYNQLNQEKDYMVLYYTGMNQAMSNNLSLGKKNMTDSRIKIKADLKANKLKIDKTIKSVLVDGFMKYTEYLINNDELEDAKKVIALAKDIYPKDGFIKVQYNVIHK